MATGRRRNKTDNDRFDGVSVVKLFTIVNNSKSGKLVGLSLSVTSALGVSTKTLAYYATELITVVKSLIVSARTVLSNYLF